MDENNNRIEELLTNLVADVSEMKTDIRGLKDDVSDMKADIAELKKTTAEIDTTLVEYIGYQESVNEEQRAFNQRLLDLVGDENGLAAAHAKLANHDTRIHKLELATA